MRDRGPVGSVDRPEWWQSRWPGHDASRRPSRSARFGITAVALAFVVADYIGMVAQLMIFQKASGIRIPSVARAIRPQCCAAALMAAVVWGVQLLMTQFGLASSEASLWRLVASVVFGASAYGAGLVLFGGIAPLLRIVSVIRGSGPAAAATPSL